MTDHYTQDTQTVQTQQNLLPKRGNPVFRQELKSLTPRCDVNCAIFCNFSLMILFFAFGIPILVSADNVQEYMLDYTKCVNDEMGYCNMTLEVKSTMTQPIYLYYEIGNFYMNHRDFVKSRNFAQLRGDVHVDSTRNSKCIGAQYVREIFDNNSNLFKTYTGNPLNGDDWANPCGLIAKSYFNDTEYTLTDSKQQGIFINETGIANDYDRQFMFKRLANSSLTQWIDVENEHFIVWMQMESFQNFRKLWGRIDEDLQPDTYLIKVKNNYNVTSFNGKKGVVLSTSSPLGTGSFFGYALIVGGGYCLVIQIVLLIFKWKNSDKIYSLDDLKWT